MEFYILVNFSLQDRSLFRVSEVQICKVRFFKFFDFIYNDFFNYMEEYYFNF